MISESTCSVSAVGTTVTRGQRLRTVNTDAGGSHAGCWTASSSMGLEQGRKWSTEGKGKENVRECETTTKNEKRGTAKQQRPVHIVKSQGECSNPKRRSERSRMPTCAARFGRWAT